MKKYLVIILFAFLMSCEPNPASEGITLPEMEFAFKVSPDTSYIRIGETFTLEGSSSSTLEGNIKLVDGEALLGFSLWHHFHNPITSGGGEHALENDHYKVEVKYGGFIYNTNPFNRVQDLKSFPIEDSFKVKYLLVFQKKGVYQFNLYSKFYEGSKGKARTSGYFDVKSPNWNFIQIPGNTNPKPGDDNYKKGFLIAVTD